MAICQLCLQIASFFLLYLAANFLCTEPSSGKSEAQDKTTEGANSRLKPFRQKRSYDSSEEKHPYHHSALKFSGVGHFGTIKFLPEYVYVPTHYFIEEEMRRRRLLLLQRQRLQELQLRRLLNYIRQLGQTTPKPATAGGGTGGQQVPSGTLPQPQTDSMSDIINSLIGFLGI